MRIIGIDPGTAICGYGIIDVHGSKLTPVAYGAITTTPDKTDAQRLEILFNDLSDILEEYKPDKCGVDELFFNRNVTTAITVGQARGVGLLTGIELVVDKGTKEPLPEEKVIAICGEMAKEGVLVGRTNRSFPNMNNVINIAPAYIVTKADIDIIVNTLRGAIKKVLG